MPTARRAAPGNGRATLATVAASRVSVATVSKVLNGLPTWRPDAALVQELLEQHQYVGAVRRGGGSGQTTPERELLFPVTSTHTASRSCWVPWTRRRRRVAIVVSRWTAGADQWSARPEAWTAALAAAGRRAVVAVVNELTARFVAELHRAHLPLVVIDPLNQPRSRITSVGSTNFTGGLSATQHLLGLGHRRIAYVGGPVEAACNQARMHGFRAAMEAQGVAVLDGYVRQRHFLYDTGVVEGAALLDLPEPPTAVFAGSDEIALGDRGRPVPRAARPRGRERRRVRDTQWRAWRPRSSRRFATVAGDGRGRAAHGAAPGRR